MQIPCRVLLLGFPPGSPGTVTSGDNRRPAVLMWGDERAVAKDRHRGIGWQRSVSLSGVANGERSRVGL
jgi:hypothetical protein